MDANFAGLKNFHRLRFDNWRWWWRRRRNSFNSVLIAKNFNGDPDILKRKTACCIVILKPGKDETDVLLRWGERWVFRLNCGYDLADFLHWRINNSLRLRCRSFIFFAVVITAGPDWSECHDVFPLG